MDNGEEILEGFLCPICMTDLRTPSQLSAHFEQVHADDRDVLHHLRSVFGKAKKKILKKEDEVAVGNNIHGDVVRQMSRGTPATGGIDLALWETQGLGANRSSIGEFKSIRKSKIERCVVETNKILIRLEKLLKSGVYSSDSTLPNVIKAKKDIEKRVVPWESDSEAKFCRHCLKRFSVINRKHHCRLCGLVMCGNCSGFVSPVKACDLLNMDPFGYACPERTSANPEEDEKNDIRVCNSCAELLQRYQKLSQEKNSNSAIISLYDKLKATIADADEVSPKFGRMAESINAGETEFRLESAMETRLKLLKLFETVDAISKKIQFFGTGGEKPLSPGLEKLQKSIRMYAANYLQDKMFTMPGLPTEDVYLELRKKRELELARQRQERKEKIAAAKKNASPVAPTREIPVLTADNATGPRISPRDMQKVEDEAGASRAGSLRNKFWKKDIKQPFTAVSISKDAGTSWGPVQVTVSSSPDPMVQQMEIIRNYIAQAKQERRYDEVELFEQNLKELELAYMKERHGR